MKYVCNRCTKVFQADDITIHYIKDVNGFEIIAICPSCLEGYLGKVNEDTKQEENEVERNKIPRKW